MRSPIVLLVCVGWGALSVCSEADAQLLPFRKREVNIPSELPWKNMAEKEKFRVLPVLEGLTVSAKGPVETFQADPKHYKHFLDNPDQAVVAWRRLGAKCVSIKSRNEGGYQWLDENGSDLIWEVVHKSEGVQVWLAEGKVKPTTVLPLVPVKALLVLRYKELAPSDGKRMMRHQSDIFVHTDGKAVSAMVKLLGKTAPQVAEQGLGQLQLFFSGLSWYLDQHPEQTAVLLRPES